jgi:hypothetical protein
VTSADTEALGNTRDGHLAILQQASGAAREPCRRGFEALPRANGKLVCESLDHVVHAPRGEELVA